MEVLEQIPMNIKFYPMEMDGNQSLHLVVQQFQLTLENLYYNLELLIYLEIKEIL